ncbi:intercellular adhesion molecule 5-like [Sceloporus undulatus]|uniref:intercellular adhesion molecule 5-like n=1 Tax=Sceloporus undulatus TaxID=8520 RepID=UPI001C4BEE49|nr:intercellular adhesion molecule 5-like [Sceloporus undulatus]
MLRLSSFLLALSFWGLCKGAEEENFVRIWPEKPVVEFGGSVVLNCSSNCEKVGLETSLSKVPIGTGNTGIHWKAFNLTNVNQWAVTPLCFARCATGAAKPRRANFTVYRAPEHVVLDPMPKMEVGKEYNLVCRVPHVAPIQNLTVTLFKGGKELQVKTFENESDPKASEGVLTHAITIQKEDSGEDLTCQATLDLRPEGPLFEKTSPSELLTPTDFPMDPHLRAPSFIESSTEMTVTCDVSGVFPAKEAKFELLYGGKKLHHNTSVSGDNASAWAVVSSSKETQNLICTVSLGPVNKMVEEVVNVYSLPKPILRLDPSEVTANATVKITCTSDGPESPEVVMQIRDTRGTLASRDPDSPFIEYEVTALEEDNGKEFRCDVELMVGGKPVVKSTSKKLTVFYAPWMNGFSCPDSIIWKEGSTEIFNCTAYGNPPPIVECTRDNTTYAIGKQKLITREDHGMYHCNATNAYGFVAKIVTIIVEFYQPNILAIVLGVVIVLAVIAVLASVYFMYYTKQKCGKYNLWKSKPKQEAGNAMEQKCLNGNASI